VEIRQRWQIGGCPRDGHSDGGVQRQSGEGDTGGLPNDFVKATPMIIARILPQVVASLLAKPAKMQRKQVIDVNEGKT
jgi:hypothetical protein